MHHAADALALLADTEYDQLRGAIQARRILVPTRTLPDDYDIPRPYAPAPSEHTSTLLSHYRDTCHASRDAAATIGRAAQAAHAPSRALTTARAASQPASPARQTPPPKPRRAAKNTHPTCPAPCNTPCFASASPAPPCSIAEPTSTGPASGCLSTPLTSYHPGTSAPGPARSTSQQPPPHSLTTHSPPPTAGRRSSSTSRAHRNQETKNQN